MTTIDLGKITFAFKGSYDSKKNYEPLDLVGFDGSTYICKENIKGFSPAHNEYWDLFIQGLPNVTGKGQLLTHDGEMICHLPAGSEKQFLKSFNGKAVWEKPSIRAGKLVEQLPAGSSSGRGNVSAFLMQDGSIRACGAGATADYANGSAAGGQRNLPQVVAIDPANPLKTKFARIFAGYYTFYALTYDGEVYSWGHNAQGQLGHGDVIHRPIATRINWFVDNGIVIKEVILPTCHRWGDGTVYFLATDGRLYACGCNANGQLGDNTTTNRTLPARCGELEKIVQVSANTGYYTSAYAINQNGQVYAWGYNGYGQLGQNNTTMLKVPTLVSNLSNIRKIIAVGGDSQAAYAQPCTYALALDKDGNVFSCGYNGYGQLGLGDTTQRNVFTPLSGGFTQVKDIFANDGCYGNSALIDHNDTVWIWGDNPYGQLGMGDTLNRSAPNKPAGDFQGNVAKVFLGGDFHYNFAFVLNKDGELWAAGYGDHGQLGVDFTHPAANKTFQRCKLPFKNKVVDVCFLGYGDQSSVLALLETGFVVGAGINSSGQLGVLTANFHNPTVFKPVIF